MDETRKLDEAPVPGGLYISGGTPGRDDKHYGGRVVDADGKVLATYEDKEVNPGAEGFVYDEEKQRVVPKAGGKVESPKKPDAK